MTSLVAQQPYRGADRRMPARAVLPARPVPVWPAAVVVLGLVVGAGLLATSDPLRAAALQDIRQVLRAALFSGAGLLLVGQWRSTGLARPALMGLALLVLGILSEGITALSPLVYGSADQPLSGPTLKLLPAVAAGVLLLAARRADTVDSTTRPLRLLFGALLTGAFAGAGILLVTASATAADEAALLAACAAWRGALWLTICLLQRRASRDRITWLAPVLTVMAMVAFLDAGHALVGEPFGAAAAVLAVVSGLMALRYAAHDLAQTVSQQSARLLLLTADVTEHQERRRTAEATEAVRLHEARNVLAGLHGATSTLRRYEDKLDPGVRHRLEDAISAELQRLQHLVDPPASKPSDPVLVPDALAPVLTAERELGAVIRADLHRVTALGCAADIATICSALLVNARVHAPGAPVLVRARRSGQSVQVVVEDGGPGVPDELREVIFGRGERGAATAPGTGLGLFNARELARAMHGTLELGDRSRGGASFVLTLPAASPPVAHRVPQQRQKRDLAGR